MDSGSRTTVREVRTTYETSSSSTPIVQPANVAHNLVITRTSVGSPARSGMQVERSTKTNVYHGAPLGSYAAMTTTGVNSVRESRDREKKDMQDLNERFANYIDKVRYLEAQNRKLADDLDKLKTKWGKETAQIKAMFQAELDEARKALDDAEKEKGRLEIRAASLEEQIEDLRFELAEVIRLTTDYNERFLRQNQLLIEYENDIQMLRKRIENLENDRDKDKRMIETLTEALRKAREDLDNETLEHIDAENRRQTLEEEIEFMKQVHDQEMKELSALCYKDTEKENRDFWKNMTMSAISEIEQMYADKLDGMRNELESHYNLKVQEFKTGATQQNIEATKTKEDSTKSKQELADLRDKLNDMIKQVADLQREYERLLRLRDERYRDLELRNGELQHEAASLKAQLDAILRNLQSIMNAKLGLELEIAAYRKLLETEENRLNMKSMIESMSAGSAAAGFSRGGRFEESSGSMAKGEISAKTTYQKSAKGPVVICECPPDGKFIQIENTGSKEENLSGWKLTRTVDNKEIVPYELNQSIKPRQKITFWSRGQKPRSAPAHDVEVSIDNWGIGAHAYTRLINKEGEERASNIQRTSYSS